MTPDRAEIIAVLIDDYVDYQRIIVDSIKSAALSSGFGLVCVAARKLTSGDRSQRGASACNEFYTLAREYPVKGIISLSGTLGLPAAELTPFLSRYRVPVVSLGLNVPDVASVIVDDSRGMTDLMEHLVNDTQCRRFAFLRGLPDDHYSSQRESIFRAVLEQHGIDVDESLMPHGHYDAFIAYNVVSELLTRHPSVDAIVAANDTMALSAARAAKDLGRHIPGDIVVTGFDDTFEATELSPAITTVRQPLEKLASLSTRTLIDRIRDAARNGSVGSVPEAPLRVESELVKRASSMPLPRLDTSRLPEENPALADILRDSMAGLRTPPGFDFDLFAAAVIDTVDTGSTELADYLDEHVTPTLTRDTAHWWDNLCHQVDESGLELLKRWKADDRTPRISRALTRTRERIWSTRMDHQFAINRLHTLRANVQVQMSSCTTRAEILLALNYWLESANARRCFLLQFQRPGPTPHPVASVAHVFRGGESVEYDSVDFRSVDILPSGLQDELEDGLLLLSPVYAGSDLFGYLLIEPSGVAFADIDATVHCIGNALRNHYLLTSLEEKSRNLKHANQELSRLANHDSLTGLPNRLMFKRHLEESCRPTPHDSRQTALMFLDLDGFKAVNDHLGHTAGDTLLREVSDRLSDAVERLVGEAGFVARLGGDEFTIILAKSDGRAVVRAVSDAVLASIARPFVIDHTPVSVTTSIGCALFPEDSDDTNVLIARADAAMYQAKQRGKNKLCFFFAEPDTTREPRQALG